MHPRAKILIESLNLQPHPEGGYYAEVFRSPRTVQPAGSDVHRSALTAIYFLLCGGMHSKWHRVSSDEAWVHLEGSPFELIFFNAKTKILTGQTLGPAAQDHKPLCVVPANVWQAAHMAEGYALVTCFVSPGFDFADFKIISDDPEEARILKIYAPDYTHLL